MSKITYLFGAGASCKALPIVKEIPDRLQATINLLKQTDFTLDETFYDNLNFQPAITKIQYQQELIAALEWLKEKSGAHASVDTFAKKLYLNGLYDDLKKLKLALTVFFIIEQHQNLPDERYDSFFAAILEADKVLPYNLRILSWNYDMQFELAFKEYSRDPRLDFNKDLLFVHEKYYRKPPPKDFSIFKLNGSTTLFPKGERWMNHPYYFVDHHKDFNKEFIDVMVRNFALVLHDPEKLCGLSFSWESDTQRDEDSIIEKSIKATEDTKILVVIGYSFPFFNREVDRKIIQTMQKLKKVYFQAPDAENLVERFQAIRDDIDPKYLIPKFDTNQFFLPNEL